MPSKTQDCRHAAASVVACSSGSDWDGISAQDQSSKLTVNCLVYTFHMLLFAFAWTPGVACDSRQSSRQPGNEEDFFWYEPPLDYFKILYQLVGVYRLWNEAGFCSGNAITCSVQWCGLVFCGYSEYRPDYRPPDSGFRGCPLSLPVETWIVIPSDHDHSLRNSLDFFFCQFTQSFQPHYGSGVYSAFNRNKYQESSWGKAWPALKA
jgi:hypothetical protein